MKTNMLRRVINTVLILLLVLILGCKNKDRERVKSDFNAKEIDFENYNFTIDFQEEVINSNILFDAVLMDVFKKHEDKYYLFMSWESNTYLYFKLKENIAAEHSMLQSKWNLKDFKAGDDVSVVAYINSFNFYRLAEESVSEEDWQVYPSMYCEGDLLEMIKK